MKHLKHSQIAQLDRMLERRALDLRSEIRRLLLESDQQHFRDLAGTVHDSADEAVADELADIGAAFLDRHVSELREVQAARERLAKGSYGLCADCGSPLEWQRLRAFPAATRCVFCVERREKAGAERTPSL